MTDQTAEQRMTAALATRIYAQRDLLPSRVRDPHCAFTRADAEMLARAILNSDWLAAEGFGDVRQAGAEAVIAAELVAERWDERTAEGAPFLANPEDVPLLRAALDRLGGAR